MLLAALMALKINRLGLKCFDRQEKLADQIEKNTSRVLNKITFNSINKIMQFLRTRNILLSRLLLIEPIDSKSHQRTRRVSNERCIIKHCIYCAIAIKFVSTQ